ncbi:MAG: TIGR04551 family protein [Deltaproteobacteria bacterium]|nr:TIGR04551 family protein [Deltaproteobacteria bacterium]
MKRLASVAAFAALVAGAGSARATGFHEVGQDFVPREKTELEVSGYLRTRGEALYNLDLDRGLMPNGQPLFPVPIGDPSAQTLTHWDMRWRTDLKLYAPGSMVAVKARFDVLDNVALGSLPEGVPSATTTQRAPGDLIRVRRAYGELLLPFGMIAAGRMGTHWGMGMIANGGDCLDCDSGDATDRVAFLTSISNHFFALAYDFSATGPQAQRALQSRAIGIEPTTDVRTVTFAMLNWRDEDARTRRRKAGKATVEYGSYITHRWQTDDIPASYVSVANGLGVSADPFANGGAGVMARGYRATAFDVWLRLTGPWARIEAEGAFLTATVDQPSLLPGVLLRQPVTSKQFGAALQSEFGPADAVFSLGLDGGYASGDPAPGFGVLQRPSATPPKAGDIDGGQASPPRDNRVDNFRFHPDFRIDRILFREILGAVTDAVYARPHVSVRLARARSAQLSAHTAGIFSSAVQARSTPSGKAPLGIEIDPSLVFETHSFVAALDYGVLFPLSGLDNVVTNQSAKPAQLIRLRLNYLF